MVINGIMSYLNSRIQQSFQIFHCAILILTQLSMFGIGVEIIQQTMAIQQKTLKSMKQYGQKLRKLSQWRKSMGGQNICLRYWIKLLPSTVITISMAKKSVLVLIHIVHPYFAIGSFQYRQIFWLSTWFEAFS